MTKLHVSKKVSLATKDGSCRESSSSSLTPRNLTPIMIDDADVDSANSDILTVQDDEDGDEDDDLDIEYMLYVIYVISFKQ